MNFVVISMSHLFFEKVSSMHTWCCFPLNGEKLGLRKNPKGNSSENKITKLEVYHCRLF